MKSNEDILTDELLARHISGELTPLEEIAFSDIMSSESIIEVKEIVSDLEHVDFFCAESMPEKKIEKIEEFIDRTEMFKELKSPDTNNSKII